jgi:sporulation protein YlmC with PRC-barrel domain
MEKKMKRLTVFLSIIIIFSMFLTACGGADEAGQTPGITATQVLTGMPETMEPGLTEPVVTDQVGTVGTGTQTGSETEPAATEPMATEPVTTETQEVVETPSATGTPAASETEVLPPTGQNNPGRLSALRRFVVCSQEGREIGDAYDFVIDLTDVQIDDIVVNTIRFEDVGRRVAVPWSFVEVRPDNDDGQRDRCENAFVLLVDQDVFADAPQLDPNALPAIGIQVEGWDADIIGYWEGSEGTGPDSGTPMAAAPTATPVVAATVTPQAGQATGTPTAGGTTPEATQKAPGGGRLQGIVLAREIIGYRLVSEDSQAMGTIRDALVDISSGQVLYVVVEIRTLGGETRLIAVPVQVLRWDPTALTFGLTVDRATLEAAPAFEGNAIPDTQTSGWDADIMAYWSDLVGEMDQE